MPDLHTRQWITFYRAQRRLNQRIADLEWEENVLKRAAAHLNEYPEEITPEEIVADLDRREKKRDAIERRRLARKLAAKPIIHPDGTRFTKAEMAAEIAPLMNGGRR